jgi:hypothetical protein
VHTAGSPAIIVAKKVERAMKKSYHLPSSGQIIGSLFEVLQIPYPPHLKKEMQRYFRGEKVDDATRKEILYLFSDTLLKEGILPAQPLDPIFYCRWGLKKGLVRTIEEYAQRWEAICAKLHYWAIPASRRQDLLFSILRLAVIDLAYRVACYRIIAGLPGLENGIPLWAKRKGSASFLKQLKVRCRKETTNTELAGEAGVANEKTLTAWFREGKRPSREHLKLLTEAFIGRMPGTEYDALMAEMTRHYTLAELSNKVAKLIGGRYCLELVEALSYQTNRIMEFLKQDKLPADQQRLHLFLELTRGALMSYQAPWLKHLWETEKDIDWKHDMVCVEKDWVSRIFQVNLRFTDEGVLERRTGTNYLYVNPDSVPPNGGYYGALLHRDDPDGISAAFDYVSTRYIENQIDSKMEFWGCTKPEAYDWDKKIEDQFREAIKSNPDSARTHLDLGIFLGLHGCLPTHLEEGYKECIKAIKLQPTWEMPWIGTANILLHAGYAERGLQVLQDATTRINRPSTRMVYTQGFARMMNRDFAGALEIFEKAGRMKPDFAPAFENAAFCAFHLGDKLRGNRYAKVARRLGISTTYDLYDVGKIKQKPKAVRFELLCETVLCPEKNCISRAELKKIEQKLHQKVPP